ncbi:FYVE and coiled-coil domain-containing protein 1 isoform X2 [Spea bombifrons]|uniref:FYVE and coiled-coil domain-containing protein 1 isoform X2 n=1 Tax=Spea bombifrons TaxID=233779 RepID=UPI002349497A|nr:FYVE and coiled-coil domain-containing protein 1 isoform X2 [Spea bombifrons]
MAGITGESQLQRIIKDLQDAVSELNKEFKEMREPITDDSTHLHKVFYKLEYLLQFDLKEKTTLLGSKKDYWDYFCDCLAKLKGANDGIRFVKSNSELKTSLGKGRAFLRYSLVHQRLADTLQQCFMNERVTKDWYYARSPFLKMRTSLEIVGYLYELTEVQFDLTAKGYDLDAAWPSFARTLGSSVSSSYSWRPPSRSSSMSSLLSSNFQVPEFPVNPETIDSLDEMHIVLDQTEVQMRELEERVKELEKENQELQTLLRFQLEQSKADKEKNHGIAEGNTSLTRMIEVLHKQHGFTLTTHNVVHELQNNLPRLKLNEPGKDKEMQLEMSSQHDALVQIVGKHRNLEILREIDTLNPESTNELDSENEHKQKHNEYQHQTRSNNVSCPSSTEMEKPTQSEEVRESALLEKPLTEALGALNKEGISKELQKEKTLTEQLYILEKQLSNMSQNLSIHEKEKQQLIIDKDNLFRSVESLEEQIEKQSLETKTVTEKNDKLICQIEELYKENERLEHENRTLQETIYSLEAQIEIFCESEKYLQNQIGTALVSVDEKEKKLWELNKQLEENLQISKKQFKNMEEKCKILEHDFKEMESQEKQANMNLSLLQTDHENAMMLISQMEGNIASMKETEKSLNAELHENKQMFEEKGGKLFDLANKMVMCTRQYQRSETIKTFYQTDIFEPLTNENDLMEKKESHENKILDITKIYVAEKQLEFSLSEMKRLQAEITEVRDMLSQINEEKENALKKVSVTETLLSENQNLIQQLKEQVEQFQIGHMEEQMKFRSKEDLLLEEREKIALQKLDLEKQTSSLKEELMQVKKWAEKTRMENDETKESLKSANVNISELNTQMLSLAKEKEEIEIKFLQLSKHMHEYEYQDIQEKEKLRHDLTALKKINTALEEKLKDHETCSATFTALEEKILESEKKVKSIHDSTQEEIATTKFKYSTEILDYQKKNKIVSDELENFKQELEDKKQMFMELQMQMDQMQELQMEKTKQLTDEVRIRTEYESLIAKYEDDAKILKESLQRKEAELETANQQFKKCSEKLISLRQETDNNNQKMLAHIDDLNRTKQYLEERLVELIRDKDALWQKSDALEFEQKMRAAERWMGDTEVNQCLDCKKSFNWMVRRHHCRLCGRIFCYYCCNNYVMTKHSGRKERCCLDCFKNNQTKNTCNSGNEENTSLQQSANITIRGVTVSEESESHKDTVFDIITDEELSQVQYSTSSLAGDHDLLDQCTAELNGISSSRTTDDSEDLQIPQDNEIHLLTTGELMLKLPLTVDEIMNFGDSNRELFIKSGTYSIIPITVKEPGLSISWIFSSDTKSITFSVVYQETESAPLDQCKVLIPMVRCNSHLESIQGELKVRNPGIYSLIFDNTFSRFVSKRVFYRLAVEQPIVYDGSDSS